MSAKAVTVKVNSTEGTDTAVAAIVSFINTGKQSANLTVEPLEDLMARGRVADCTCGLIECMCKEVRQHAPGCKYIFAATCAVAIECDHGYDVCPQCDPCYCSGVKL